VTGRTHQLRVHCAAIGTPILGDGKYGGARALIAGVPNARLLHLHARALRIPHPRGGWLEVEAPLPPHMAETWEFFGFSADTPGDPFAELEL
jgi:23S rRNA pseudouridine955/2504/2580 synthase